MKSLYLIEGGKGAGKSEWIIRKKDEFLKEGWNLIDCKNEEDRNTVIFVVAHGSKKVVLNSGSDTKAIIKEFGAFLAKHSDAYEVYTAIRPKDLNCRLHYWMRKTLDMFEFEVKNTLVLE